MQISGEEIYNPMVLVITFNSRHYDMTSIERYVGQSNIAFIYDVLTRNVAWTSVIHESMNLVGPKKVHLRKLLASVNIYS